MAGALAADEVRALAHLARLEVDDADVARLGPELGAILDHVACLAEVDTTGVEPMTHAVAVTLRLRDDEPGPCLPTAAALAAAPGASDAAFEVPVVIGGS